MKKSILALLLVVLMGLAACGNAGSSAPESSSQPESSSEVSSEAATPEPTEEPTPEPTHYSAEPIAGSLRSSSDSTAAPPRCGS